MAVTIFQGGIPVVMQDSPWPRSSSVDLIGPSTWMMGGELSDPLEVWRTQRSVRTVVGFLARNIAQIALHAFRRQDDGDRDRIAASAALPRLLRQPNVAQTGYDFMHALVVDICLWDRFAALIRGDGDGVVELVRLPPRRWRFKRDPVTDLPIAVELLTANGKAIEAPLSEFLWLDGYPAPNGEASSPLDSLRELLVEERESSRYRRELWENGARMPGWIARPGDAPQWSPKGRDNFREGWQKYAAGGVRAGRTPILEEGMEYHELASGITPESAQQLETRKFSIAETAAAFYVPPVFVGVLDNANYSNVTAYREILYSDTLGPWIQQLQQAYNARLLPNQRIDADPDEFVEFNVSEKLRMSFDQQIKILTTATGAPIMLRNEARQRVNLPRVEGGDELITPLNLLEGNPNDDSADESEE